MENFEKFAMGLLIATLFVMGFNAFQISQLRGSEKGLTANTIAKDNASMQNIGRNNPKTASGIDIIPKGVPDVYGWELGISFDDVSASNQQKADATIKKLGILDQQISLSGNDMQRYISVAGKISCEYCCGTDSIIFGDGKPACGCQHSFAMRGLAKYLIKNHGDEYTDDMVLEELGKWKTLFFPSKITEKAVVLKEKGIGLSYINLASNKFRGIENGN